MSKRNQAKRRSGKSRPRGRPNQGRKPPNQREESKNWTLFTKCQVHLVECARALDERLKRLYGKAASISKFEKALLEIPELVESLQSRLHMPGDLQSLFSNYREARAARDEEMTYFRDSRTIVSLQAAAEKVFSQFSAMSSQGPDEEESGEETDF